MCRFQADDEAQSRIYVDLNTLGSTEPTLAGLAYLSKVPMPSTAGGANPATGYCSDELNGSSSFGGAGAAGGGWVAQSDPDDVVVSLCVFPDGSFIDEWGLAYHSAGEIRGEDLATVIRYQPSGPLPAVFPGSQVRPTA
jgi:putative hemolysin